METFSFIFVLIVFTSCWIIMRDAMKKTNNRYGIVDDLLYFTGVPPTFFNIVITCIVMTLKPENYIGKSGADVFGTPLTWCLLCWMVISSVIFLLRYYKKS